VHLKITCIILLSPSITTITVFQSLLSSKLQNGLRTPFWTTVVSCCTEPPDVKFVTAHAASFWDLKSPYQRNKEKVQFIVKKWTSRNFSDHAYHWTSWPLSTPHYKCQSLFLHTDKFLQLVQHNRNMAEGAFLTTWNNDICKTQNLHPILFSCCDCFPLLRSYQAREARGKGRPVGLISNL